jgi:HEAT repeat protein
MMATVAVWALLKIEPTKAERFETAVPLLRKALRGDAELVRLEAAVALGDIGPKAASAIPILELVAEDDPVDAVRKAAQAALARIKNSPPTP